MEVEEGVGQAKDAFATWLHVLRISAAVLTTFVGIVQVRE
jgi:hypothetical protein